LLAHQPPGIPRKQLANPLRQAFALTLILTQAQ
jgi:hypothetical protein